MSIVRKTVEDSAVVEAKREFTGKAWNNTVNKEGSKANGMNYINITLDNTIDVLSLKAGDKIQLWPNAKREGKQDADWRMSVIFAE